MVLKSKDDQVTVIGAGVTLHEALAAAELLKKGEEKGTQAGSRLSAVYVFCAESYSESHLVK